MLVLKLYFLYMSYTWEMWGLQSFWRSIGHIGQSPVKLVRSGYTNVSTWLLDKMPSSTSKFIDSKWLMSNKIWFGPVKCTFYWTSCSVQIKIHQISLRLPLAQLSRPVGYLGDKAVQIKSQAHYTTKLWTLSWRSKTTLVFDTPLYNSDFWYTIVQ